MLGQDKARTRPVLGYYAASRPSLRDDATQFAAILALGAAAMCLHEGTAAAAIGALGAAGSNGTEVSCEGNVREVHGAYGHRGGGGYLRPRTVRRRIWAFMRLAQSVGFWPLRLVHRKE